MSKRARKPLPRKDAVGQRPAQRKDGNPVEWIDEEFAGKHGTTALKDSLIDEAHPEIDPQTPKGATQKLKAEVHEGDGLLDRAKRLMEELDRQIAGEYERREDATSARPARKNQRR